MAFPITVTFNDRLKTVVTADNKQLILLYIANYIREKKADNINIENDSVTYEGSTASSNWGKFNGVDNGIFTLLFKNDKWYIEYQINMRKLFIYTPIMVCGLGIFFALGGGPWWWPVLFGFLWLCGGNWLINWVRHGALATDLAEAIDEQFYLNDTATSVLPNDCEAS